MKEAIVCVGCPLRGRLRRHATASTNRWANRLSKSSIRAGLVTVANGIARYSIEFVVRLCHWVFRNSRARLLRLPRLSARGKPR